MNQILDNFEYNNKAWYLKAADEILSPVRGLFGGKTVTCIKRDDAYTFRVPNSFRQPSLLIKTITKITQLLLTALIAPLALAAVACKAIANGDHQQTLDRFKLVRNPTGDRQTKDRIQEREILEESWILRGVEYLIEKKILPKYTQIREDAHILADKALKKRDGINNPLTKYEGGYELRSGQLLSNELSKFKKDETIGPEVIKAKEKVDEYVHWCGRFKSVIFLKILGDTFVQDLAMDLKNRIEFLEAGESFLIPIVPQTHLIVAKFMCIDKDNYAFKVYNIGAGAGHHNYSDLRFSPFCINRIPLNNLISLENFLIPLIKCSGRSEKVDSFYSFLETSFKKVVGEENFNKEAGNAKRIQFSGTCIWRSLLAALKDSMPLVPYKHFVLKMKKDRWWGLHEKYYYKNNVDPDEKKDATLIITKSAGPLQKAFREFATLTNKTYDEVLESEFNDIVHTIQFGLAVVDCKMEQMKEMQKEELEKAIQEYATRTNRTIEEVIRETPGISEMWAKLHPPTLSN